MCVHECNNMYHDRDQVTTRAVFLVFLNKTCALASSSTARGLLETTQNVSSGKQCNSQRSLRNDSRRQLWQAVQQPGIS